MIKINHHCCYCKTTEGIQINDAHLYSLGLYPIKCPNCKALQSAMKPTPKETRIMQAYKFIRRGI